MNIQSGNVGMSKSNMESEWSSKINKMYKVNDAIIMAAGTSSRFAPLSYEMPKALIEINGEVLIERQIKQLKEAGIENIAIVVGYKKEQFNYLKDKYGVILIENDDYLIRNNNASIWAAKDYLANSYICSSDNYFIDNPFHNYEEDSFYSALYANGKTNEWCMKENKDGYINEVSIGGDNAWYMLGHAFWNNEFSSKFIDILEKEYNLSETKDLLWEAIYMKHLDKLKMKIKKYPKDYIFEFDTLDELRLFDESYIYNTRSKILKEICKTLRCEEKDIANINNYKTNDNAASGFTFSLNNKKYKYSYIDKNLIEE